MCSHIPRTAPNTALIFVYAKVKMASGPHRKPQLRLLFLLLFRHDKQNIIFFARLALWYSQKKELPATETGGEDHKNEKDILGGNFYE